MDDDRKTALGQDDESRRYGLCSGGSGDPDNGRKVRFDFHGLWDGEVLNAKELKRWKNFVLMMFFARPSSRETEQAYSTSSSA
jgi:hypothetical protein